jgi:hypothetical protein
MKQSQLQITLKPLHDGSFTRWRLCGSVVTAVPHTQMRRLFKQLAFLSGWPVELVLPVDVGTAAWFEWWTDTIVDIPADHLQVRFAINRLPPRGMSHEQRKPTDSPARADGRGVFDGDARCL